MSAQRFSGVVTTSGLTNIFTVPANKCLYVSAASLSGSDAMTKEKFSGTATTNTTVSVLTVPASNTFYVVALAISANPAAAAGTWSAHFTDSSAAKNLFSLTSTTPTQTISSGSAPAIPFVPPYVLLAGSTLQFTTAGIGAGSIDWEVWGFLRTQTEGNPAVVRLSANTAAVDLLAAYMKMNDYSPTFQAQQEWNPPWPIAAADVLSITLANIGANPVVEYNIEGFLE